MNEITDFQRQQLLALLMHHCGPETRRILMRELPQAYNAWYGREIVKVVMPS